jgi:hypothetical protein
MTRLEHGQAKRRWPLVTSTAVDGTLHSASAYAGPQMAAQPSFRQLLHAVFALVNGALCVMPGRERKHGKRVNSSWIGSL